MMVHSFPPIATPTARTLILGTMPGRASLEAGQYYAHPRNLFWKLTGAIVGFDPAAAYDVRTAGLTAGGIALWDVLKTCTRRGSLDSAIDPSTVVSNDFRRFLLDHPRVTHICFNGTKAESLFLRHVHPGLGNNRTLSLVRLPSTSPANASITLTAKLKAWRAIVHGELSDVQ